MNKLISLEQYPNLKAAHDLMQRLPGAVIAGGCPRDILLNREFKDIDVFVPTFSNERLLVRTGMTLASVCNDLGLNLAYDDEGYMLYHCITRYCGEGLDVIVSPHFAAADELIRRFDTPICIAWMTPTDDGFDVHSTEQFDQFVERRILGYVLEMTNFERLERLTAKFADYLPVPIARELLDPAPSRPALKADVPF